MNGGGGYSGLPDIIKELMGSPQMTDILKSIAPTQSEPAPSEKKGADAISLPPDLMDKLPGVISALRDAGIGPPAKEDASQSANELEDIAAKIPQAMSVISNLKSKPPETSSKNRKALLTALKPYMGDRKRAAIDTMLSVDSMTEVLQMMMGGEK